MGKFKEYRPRRRLCFLHEIKYRFCDTNKNLLTSQYRLSFGDRKTTMNFAVVVVIIGLAGAFAVDTAAPSGNGTVAPTTSAAPTTTPDAPTINPTTAKPTDPPIIQDGIFHLNKDNKTCILLQLGARITDGENVVDLPKDATVSGNCEKDIILTFGNNTLRIPFVQTNNGAK